MAGRINCAPDRDATAAVTAQCPTAPAWSGSLLEMLRSGMSRRPSAITMRQDGQRQAGRERQPEPAGQRLDPRRLRGGSQQGQRPIRLERAQVALPG